MEIINEEYESTTDTIVASEATIPDSNDDLTFEPCEIIIEEISRNHKLLHRHRLKQNNITIGRDYNNDIILTDPHICPQHLSLRYSQGNWHINDHNSINGTELEKAQSKKQNAHQKILSDSDVITLGKSQLRVLFKDHKVAETIAFSPFEYLIDFIRSPVAVLSIIALFMLTAANMTYLNQTTETNFSQIFVGAFSKSLLFAMWPIGVALISHLTKNEPRILAQLGVSFTFFILMWATSLLEDIIAFNTASNSLTGLLITIITVGLAFSLFWLNSYIGFHVSARRRMAVALTITLLLFGGTYLLQYSQQPEFDPYPRYNSTIMAPSYLMASSNNVETFINDSSHLFDKARKTIQEEE